jgi:pimeloyl-ACP methyl ester carboxylesterase
MRRSEVEAVGELAGEALAAGSAFVREMHAGIAGRSFRALGAAGAPVRAVHDSVSGAVYSGLGDGMRRVARGGARMAARRQRGEADSLAERPVASLVLGALNGFYGHHLTGRSSELAIAMEVRQGDQVVSLSPGGLAAAFPQAGARVVVFVHGLCETEAAWRLPARGTPPEARRPYGARLAGDLGFTPVYLRYNTGLHISENGRRLAEMLEALVEVWPVEVEELVLIGHSMGGLVARSACHYAERDSRRWAERVRHVFCLGTPHLGADLEKGANLLAWTLGRLPETRPLATVLNARSVGIKDLRYGSCVEEDWCDCDPDEFLRDRCREVPFLPDANYYFIGATLNDGPFGTLLGDLLVRMPSASGRGNGRGRRIPFEVDNGRELSGLTHFDLLCHPAVYDQIRTWITRPAATAVGSAPACG